MKRCAGFLGGSLVLLAAVVAAPATRAGTDISFGMSAPLGDDGNLFFSISSRYFDRDVRVVDDWGRRFPNPDDLAVFLHISSHARVAPGVVYGYRQRGMSWYDVGVRVGVPREVWYVGPYGKAHGHSKKHKHGSRKSYKLRDREVRDLVAVRMAHEYYGVAPERAMDWRRQGADVRVIMTREYRGRHGDEHDGKHGKHEKHGKH